MAAPPSIRGLSLFLKRSVLTSRRDVIPASSKFLNGIRHKWFSSFPPHEVVGLPSLSPTMESGSIAQWNLKEGDAFAAGDVMCSVETDKATVDFEAQDDGIIAKILVEAGPEEIRCGQPILVTVDEGDISLFADFKVEDAKGDPLPKEENPPPSPETAPPAATVPITAPAASTARNRLVASPLAYTLAKEMGYNIGGILGTGPGGRIIAADVKECVPREEAVSSATAMVDAASTEAMLEGPPVHSDGFTDFLISQPSQNVAARLAQSKRNIPHYYLTVDITMDELLETRASLNRSLGGKNGEPNLGVYEFLIKAAAGSMKVVPTANGSWMDSVIRVYDSVDINVVMGSGDTLCTPVLRDCQKKGIQRISTELAQAVSFFEGGEKKISSSDSGAGTFTILNIGMYGVKSCAPIIRECQACALALGALENRIVPDDNEGSKETYKESVVMTATLSCDHRVVDGAVGAKWLSAFKAHVENPSTLLL